MTPKQRNRLIITAVVVVCVAASVGLTLVALNKNINLFYSPTQVVAGEAPRGHTFRIGGLVKEGSVRRAEDTLEVRFEVTDGANEVTVVYDGILPDLFRDGQGIVAQGRMADSGSFVADQVLAKHDENYMPPEVEHALETARTLGVAEPAEK